MRLLLLLLSVAVLASLLWSPWLNLERIAPPEQPEAAIQSRGAPKPLEPTLLDQPARGSSAGKRVELRTALDEPARPANQPR